jgi:hypothetical protein
MFSRKLNNDHLLSTTVVPYYSYGYTMGSLKYKPYLSYESECWTLREEKMRIEMAETHKIKVVSR